MALKVLLPWTDGYIDPGFRVTHRLYRPMLPGAPFKYLVYVDEIALRADIRVFGSVWEILVPEEKGRGYDELRAAVDALLRKKGWYLL